jgi:hypothetical protein
VGRLTITITYSHLLATTFSGDGTAHRNIQFSSRYTVAIPPDGDPPKDLFLGTTLEVNHTATTQFEGWKETVQHLCDNHKKCPLGNIEPANPTHVREKLRGYLSDHASDHKLLSTMLQR